MARASSATSAQPRRVPVRAFRSWNFTLFWFASLLSMISFFILIIARGWLVLELTNSPFMVTAVAGAAQLPSLFLSVPGGVIADRFNRKAIMLAGEAVNMVAMLAMALLVTSGVVQVWHIFLLGLLNGSAFALAFPSRAAVVPNLVPREDIANGVALSSTMFSGAMLIGPGIAGWLLATYSSGIAFVVPTAASAAAVLLFFFVRVKVVVPNEDGRRGSVVENVGEGLSYIWHHQIIRGLMVIGLVVVIFGMPYQTVLPVFARDVLVAGELGLGLLGAAGGLGAIAGSLVVATFSGPHQMRMFLVIGVLGLGAFIVLFGLSPVFIISLWLAMATGFLLQLALTANFALIQVLVPDHLRGRVLSIRFIIFGLSPAGTISLGTAAEAFGTPLATAGTGILCLLGGGITLLLFSSLRRFTPDNASTHPTATDV